MNKKLFILFPLLLLLGAGCNNNQEFVIQQQQKQIEVLSKKVDEVTQSNKTIEETQKKNSEAIQKSNNSFFRKYIPSVVYVSCPQADDEFTHYTGSGILTRGIGGHISVYTNAHVVGNPNSIGCVVSTVKNDHDNPLLGSGKSYSVDVESLSQTKDIAILKLKYIIGEENKVPQFSSMDEAELVAAPSRCKRDVVHSGDKVITLGYPDIGGETITVTEGIVSGFETRGLVNYIVTSAKISHGNSGGLAIHQSGCSLGITTMADADEIGSLGYIIDMTK